MDQFLEVQSCVYYRFNMVLHGPIQFWTKIIWTINNMDQAALNLQKVTKF